MEADNSVKKIKEELSKECFIHDKTSNHLFLELVEFIRAQGAITV